MTDGGQARKVAVVGPTHPYKGGVAAHTTELARRLAAAGHDVDLVSWSQLYPAVLYPGEQAVPDGLPDLPPYPATTRPLHWGRPDTWVRTGRRLRGYDLVVVVHVVPAVVPAHLALLRAARAGRPGGPRAVVVAHNVLPHEPHRGAAALVESLLRAAGAVVVHSQEQAALAREHGASDVVVADLPPHLPGGSPAPRPEYDGPARLLALGIVRDYKGVDLLIEALREVEGPTLTVAGELWGEAGERVRRLAHDPALKDRVTVQPGYVPGPQVAALLARHDVLALTYRAATASQNVLLARRHGLAVLATRVGTFPDQVRDGEDGLLVDAGDPAALVDALKALADPATTARLRAGVRPPDLSAPWTSYVDAVVGAAAATGAAPRPAAAPHESVRTRATSLRARGRARLESLSGRTDREVPETVRPTQVLAAASALREALDEARSLRLPVTDRPESPRAGTTWASLGALAAVLRLPGGGSAARRDLAVLDVGGSPLSDWLALYGVDPAGLHTGSPLGVPARSLDALVDLGGRPPSDATRVREHAHDLMATASGALRPGGLLVLALPYDAPSGGLGRSDVRGLVASAHGYGLDLVGDVDAPGVLDHETPVLVGGGTVVLLTFRRR